MIADLAITLDGHDVALSLARVETPAAEELRDGQGTIRIETSTRASTSNGRHRLVVRNGHLPGLSVYLANALLPDAANTRILQQTRDLRQQTFSLDYEIQGVNSDRAGVAAGGQHHAHDAGLRTPPALRRRSLSPGASTFPQSLVR